MARRFCTHLLSREDHSRIIENGGHTAGAVVDVCNKPGTAALHLLNLFDVSLSMRIPGCGGVLNDCCDICCLTGFFDLTAAFTEVSCYRKDLVEFAFLVVASTCVLKFSLASR